MNEHNIERFVVVETYLVCSWYFDIFHLLVEDFWLRNIGLYCVAVHWYMLMACMPIVCC